MYNNYSEFYQSRVHSHLIFLNFKEVSGDEAYDLLLYSDKLPRRNDGRLNGKTLESYRFVENGGWYVSATDPETGEERLWGQFKPNYPKTDKQG